MMGLEYLDVLKYKTSPELDILSKNDAVAKEIPIALVYNGISHVVMMATPHDLYHFAYGFSLSEGIIDTPKDIYGIEINESPYGVEVQIELSSRQFVRLKEQRRNLTGRTGCGICGTEQIEQIYKKNITALNDNQSVSLLNFQEATHHLKSVQKIGAETGCTHAAVWLSLEGEFKAGFEDIGRHVALDKLLGYRSKQEDQQGVVLVSSRASYEMVQKMLVCKAEILFSLSATTSLAVDMARQFNLTLVSFFKNQQGVIYSGNNRITDYKK